MTAVRFLLPVIAAGLLLAPALRADDSTPPGDPISGDADLRAALVNHTFYGHYEGGHPWIEYYAPDGRSAYWDGCTHDGRWWIADGHACFRYRGDVQNTDYCWLVYRDGSQLDFVMPDDASPTGAARAYTTAIRNGNSENLPLGADDCVSVERAPFSRPVAYRPAD